MGFSVNDEASQEATAAGDAALQLLDALTPAVLQAFGTGIDCLAMPLVPFISAYVARLKTLAKRNQGMPGNVGLHLQKMLEGIAVAVRYPDDGPNAQQAVAAAAVAGGSGRVVVSEADALAAKEEQWEVEERRKELMVLLKNVAKLAWDEVVVFVGQLLQQVMGQQPAAAREGVANGSMAAAATAAVQGGEGAAREANFQDVEVAVTLLYEIGEGAPEEALKPGAAAAGGGVTLAQLVLVLLSRGAHVPSGDHRIVSLAVMETAVRYCRIVQQQQSVIPEVLTLFCGPRGIAHPYPDVSTRACYLFARLVKQLRSNVRPYVAEILQNLEPQLQLVATVPPVGSSGSGLSSCSSKDSTLFASGSGSRDPSGKLLAPSTSVIDDRLYVFEAVGLLLGQEELDAARQQEALRSLLQTLTQQIEGNLQAAAAAAAAAGDGGRSLPLLVQGRPGPVWLILQAVEAIIRVNKGFKTDLCTKSRPQLGGWCWASSSCAASRKAL
jgi:exportin-T